MNTTPYAMLLGIDPGISGAIAVLDLETLDLIDGFVLPSGDGRINVADLLDHLDDLAPLPIGQVVIENVHSMPRQGVSTTFTFGRAFGTIEGVMLARRVPVDYIAPHVWKKKLSMPKDDKDGPRQWARRRWPQSDLFGTKVRGQAIADAAALAVAWAQVNR
jgi:crossover junction endodeoxyribonuclease RuvC